jgi:hypothetical protein
MVIEPSRGFLAAGAKREANPPNGGHFAASSEAVDAFPGTKRRSPGVVPNETKLALAHRASRGSSGYKIFGAGIFASCWFTAAWISL